MNEKMLNETIAEIRNKLQGSITVLEMLSSGKNISKNFVSIALKDLNKAVELLKEFNL